MTTPRFRYPPDRPAPANTGDADEPRIPGFIDILHRIGAGAAANGHA